jgi:hypothetical protein
MITKNGEAGRAKFVSIVSNSQKIAPLPHHHHDVLSMCSLFPLNPLVLNRLVLPNSRRMVAQTENHSNLPFVRNKTFSGSEATKEPVLVVATSQTVWVE